MSPGYPFPPPVSYPPLPTVTARRTSTWLIVSGAVAAVLVFCALAAGGVYVLRARLMAVQATPTGEPSNLQPVATDAATPASINLPPGWVIVYHNSLKNGSDLWPTDTHCFFGADGYHVKDGYICPPDLRAASDVDIVAQVKQFGGDENAYGITLRYTRGVGLYEFLITRFGYWGFYTCDLAAQKCSAVIRFAHTDALQEGQDTLNTMEARAVGTHFNFYLNGIQVGQADNSTYATGLTALFAGQDMECVFSNLTIAQPI